MGASRLQSASRSGLCRRIQVVNRQAPARFKPLNVLLVGLLLLTAVLYLNRADSLWTARLRAALRLQPGIWPTLRHVRHAPALAAATATGSSYQPALPAVCTAKHAALTELGSRAAAGWWTGRLGGPLSVSRWESEVLPTVTDSAVTAAVAVIGTRVFLTRPMTDMPAGSRHVWLRGMLAHVLAAARTMHLPAVQFLLTTSDWPLAPTAQYPQFLPVLGAVQTPAAHDVAVPGGTFFEHQASTVPPYATFAAAAAGASAELPWGNRRDKAFFRGALTCYDNSNCVQCVRAVVACLAASAPDLLDVGLQLDGASPVCQASVPHGCRLLEAGHTDMMDHVQHKYLLQLDGHTYSYRLQKLLAVGGTVLRQQSEYSEFYEPLLQPYTHIWPVSACRSREGCNVTQAVQQARGQPQHAAIVAAAGQRFAHEHLAPVTGRLCYLSSLLQAAAAHGVLVPAPAAPLPHWEEVTDADVPPPSLEDLTALLALSIE